MTAKAFGDVGKYTSNLIEERHPFSFSNRPIPEAMAVPILQDCHGLKVRC
jgi:hypothetical protein